jgi:hypothetical protein
MVRHILTATFLVFGLLAVCETGSAANSAVPEPFQGFDEDSKYTISYDDLTDILKLAVVDVGRSTREVAAPRQAATGTRMKTSVKRSTISEGNRFYFETFDSNEEARNVLIGIQKSLEALPDEAPLKYFSRDEQLAYWLNLYNVTILNELIAIYPKRNLKKVLKGKKSIKAKKILSVAGVSLSLDDIQYTILKNNYHNNPLVIYGLYQGNIGGPNIRRRAYVGSDVWRALKNNADEFINSNRGTYSRDSKIFRVSSLYDRNRAFFPDFQEDLSKHILVYVEGDERQELQSASTLKPDIDDWTITDLGGTDRNFGAGFANNNAALLDSVKSTVPADGGGVTAAAAGYGAAAMIQKTQPVSRYSPELLVQLQAINAKREATNLQNATVTIEELGEVPVEPKPEPDTEDKDEN